jgi:acetate kinase
MRLLVVNTGSSSLKLQILDGPATEPHAANQATSDASPEPGGRKLSQGAADWHSGPSRHVADWDGRDVSPIADLVAEAGAVTAVGHRVVHGGLEFRDPTLIDDNVVAALDALTPVAPLHQQRALAGIAAARKVLPNVPHVACFDTAYHATIPEAAATYALPAEWRQRWPLCRFGFHGLSHAYAARRAAEMIGRTDDADLRVVTCHLGAGASLCASRGGRSVDTTMGFTPLEGLVMATRSGSVDPGLILWLITEAGLTPEEVSQALEHQSGLLGLAGTPDMAKLLEEADAGNPEARLARDVYVHALAKGIAAMTASLAGLDALVFTGGIGEHSPDIRAATTTPLPHLGIAIDHDMNETCEPDADISAFHSKAKTLVLTAREDAEITQQVRTFITPHRGPH